MQNNNFYSRLLAVGGAKSITEKAIPIPKHILYT